MAFGADKLFCHEGDMDKLWMAEWYTHANTNKFLIQPYELDVDTLYRYRDRILSFRVNEILSYHKRMKTIFNVDSNYRRDLIQE